MGIDPISIALMAMSVGSAVTGMKNAKSQAKALTREAEITAKNKAIQTNAKAAAQKVSFLSSGFTLEGTPSAVLTSTFTTGKEDVNQIIGNANTQSKNIMSQARSQAMGKLANAGMTAYSGGMFDTAMTQGTNTAMNMGIIGGNTAYDLLDSYDLSMGYR